MTSTKRSAYAELHCHSAFSLLDGASSPEELAAEGKRIGLSALAITDHDDMGGVVRFATAAKELDLPAIIGAELTFSGHEHLICLAKDLGGYKNICHLITKARMRCPRGEPTLTYEELSAHKEGVLVLSGCQHGPLAAALARGDLKQAENATEQLLAIFGNDFFIEVFDHQIRQEAVLCKALVEIANRYQIPWLPTNNVHYATAEKRIIHDVLSCLKHNLTLSTAGTRLRPNGNYYLKSPSEMADRWRAYPEALENTLVVAERCQFRLGVLKPDLPKLNLGSENLESPKELLARLVWEGAAERYGPRLQEKHLHQLNYELELIHKLDIAPYFLIMWDIVRFCREKEIACQGRGSAANSAVCYCLKITAVDPIGMELLFERFISEDRNEPPDIDLDIAHQEREIVLQYVYEKYGRQHAAMVCEHISYRGASAVRDAARVLDFAPEQADRLAAEMSYKEASEAAQMLADGAASRAGLDINDHRVQMLIKVVAGLHQLPRHRSIHVGGFVLSGEPIGGIVPVEPAAMADRTVIQWDKDDIDLAGLIKIDLLGLGMLTMIQEGLKLIKKHRRKDVDLSQLDMNDPEIYKMLQKADTVGVFQVESRAQMNILPKLKPTCFYDIIVSIAIVRPGPIQGKIIHPYLKRRRGLEKVTYLHPSIEPILKRTLGVPLFQEQGMKLAVVAAGFSPSEADQLRRVMSHKRSLEKMAKLCEKLAAGMIKNGFSPEAVETITFQLKAFANYGFPESHAASFALLVFASAYIKRYYAPEFYCAILNAQPMGFYSPSTLIRDAMRHGVKVFAPDIALSRWDCHLEDSQDEEPALRIGMRYLDGLGRQCKELLEKAWAEGGSFKSLEDVCLHSGLGKKDLEKLARAGALESLCPGRRNALWQILKLWQRKELPLLKLLEEKLKEQEDKAILTPMTEVEETVADYTLMGLSTGKHPMAYYRPWAESKHLVKAVDLHKQENGFYVQIAGCVICRQRPATAKGFVFITLEDESGSANVVINPQVFAKYKNAVLGYNFLLVSGRLQLEESVTNIIAKKIEALPNILEEKIPISSRDFH